MDNDLLYQIALTQVPNIGDVRAKTLIDLFGDAMSVFKAPKNKLENVEGIGTMGAKSIKTFNDFSSCEAEIKFIEKYKIEPLFITSKNYPQRLLNCYDSPVLMYYRGTADLNGRRIVSVVGTRNNSAYGKMVCEEMITALKEQDILIVSGLAFGVDSIAHKTALKNNMQTVAVLAHGLDRIYPAQNKMLAKQMIDQGGLLTDFKSGTSPDRQNFPKRNRIAAGICDALVVIESGTKGGSLITAELGNSYNKDVFAIPGRTNDSKSEGCNYLIKNNKAILITSAADLLEIMNWKPHNKTTIKKQRELFIEMDEDEKRIVQVLQQKESCQVDELYFKSGLSSSAAAGALLMLEMKGIILSLPGKIYKLA